MKIQSFVDVEGRREPIGDYSRHAFDVDTQYSMRLGARHQLIAGAGYRFTSERFDGHTRFLLIPPEDNASLVTAFVQDEIALLSNRLALTGAHHGGNGRCGQGSRRARAERSTSPSST